MKSILNALKTFAFFLETNHIPYMVIGGMANLHWGESRTTLDIDITTYLDDKDIPSLIQRLPSDYKALPENPLDFIRKNRVLPILDIKNNVRIDMIFGILLFEKEAVERAVKVEIEGQFVRYCTPEDLILHKIISERPKDRLDCESLMEKNLNQLDMAYLLPRVKSLAEMLERPEILANFEKLIRGSR